MERVGDVFCTSPQPSIADDESSYSYQFLDRPQRNWSAIDEEDVWERFLKEIDAEGHEMMRRFVSKVEQNVPFEQVFRDHFGGKPAASHKMEKIARKMGRERDEGGFVMRERGVDDLQLQGDLKNERFKVKTMNVPGSGVVKEEDGN